MLKRKVDSLEGIDAKYHDLYKKEGDGFVLEVDAEDTNADDNKGKLDEFRTNNRKLFKENKDLAERIAKFDGINPDDIESLLETQKKTNLSEEEKLKASGDVDTLVERRTAKMREDHIRQLKLKDDALTLATTGRASAVGELTKVKLDSAVRTAIEKVGKVKTGAMSDVLSRAGAIFSIDDTGALVAKENDGEQAFDKGGDPLTVDTWSKTLVTDAAHLFEAGGGSGSKGSGGTKLGHGAVINPDDQEGMSANLDDIAAGKIKVAGPTIE